MYVVYKRQRLYGGIAARDRGDIQSSAHWFYIREGEKQWKVIAIIEQR